MQLPRPLARFNKVVTNRVQGVYAWLLPPWAVILHRGRRTGRAYRTPVLAFRHGDAIVVALLYGTESDWLRNIRAGQGSVVRMGRTRPLAGPPRVTATGATPELERLGFLARAYCRLAENQAVMDLGARLPGFGPRRG